MTGTGYSQIMFWSKVNKAVKTNGGSDWVDLGFVTDACITQPDTCGPEGAALAVFMKPPLDLFHGSAFGGLISSYKDETTAIVTYLERVSNDIM